MIVTLMIDPNSRYRFPETSRLPPVPVCRTLPDVTVC